ncbi:MAG: heme biosynthesis HemY N-terminal domain-containing protein [Lysobacteraceae bacterium]
MNLFRHILFWILAALAGALLAQVLIQDPGFVLVRYLGTTIEATLVGGLLLIGAALFALWLSYALLRLPFRLWYRRRERIARARLGDGVDALHQGRYAQAEKLLTQAARDPQFEAPARVAAARAALARGDDTAAAGHLDALPVRYAASRAVVLAETALAEDRIGDAVAALDSVTDQALPPRGLVLRADALAASGQSAQAYGMLGALRQQQALSATQLAGRERLWAERALREAADPNALADHWDALPASLRNTPAVVRAYADRATALRWDDAAASSLEQAIETQWDESLAAHYGTLPVDRLDTAALERRRAHADSWLQAHPASSGALLGVARLARAQGQWPQAEQMLHRAIAQGGGGEAWEALGDGFTQAGDDTRARLCYLNALRATRGEAIEPMPGRDLKQQILAEAAIEERDAHGLPRLRG